MSKMEKKSTKIRFLISKIKQISFIIDMEEQPEEVHPELPEMDFTTLEKDEFKTVDVTEEENK